MSAITLTGQIAALNGVTAISNPKQEQFIKAVESGLLSKSAEIFEGQGYFNQETRVQQAFNENVAFDFSPAIIADHSGTAVSLANKPTEYGRTSYIDIGIAPRHTYVQSFSIYTPNSNPEVDSTIKDIKTVLKSAWELTFPEDFSSSEIYIVKPDPGDTATLVNPQPSSLRICAPESKFELRNQVDIMFGPRWKQPI